MNKRSVIAGVATASVAIALFFLFVVTSDDAAERNFTDPEVGQRDTNTAGGGDSGLENPGAPGNSMPAGTAADGMQTDTIAFPRSGEGVPAIAPLTSELPVRQESYSEEVSPSSEDDPLPVDLQESDDPASMLPRYWRLGSSALSTSVGDFIELRSDFERVWHGGASALVRAKRPVDSHNTAGVIQISNAEPFQQKRLAFSGFLQVTSTDSSYPASAMIWIRADDATGRVVAFQNTMGRTRFQDAVWQKASIVIDIPAEATALYYGASLVGNGSAWIDSLSIEEVGKTTPVTSRPYTRQVFNPIPDPGSVLDSPANLDFEETYPASDQ